LSIGPAKRRDEVLYRPIGKAYRGDLAAFGANSLADKPAFDMQRLKGAIRRGRFDESTQTTVIE
jgi:hypothetical protein